MEYYDKSPIDDASNHNIDHRNNNCIQFSGIRYILSLKLQKYVKWR